LTATAAAVRILLLRLTSAAALLATALAGLLTLLVGFLPATLLLTGAIVLIVGLFSAALVLVLILIHLEYSFIALRPMCQPALVIRRSD
jgi:hypothetical protein